MILQTKRIGYCQSDNPDVLFRTYKACEDYYCDWLVTRLNGDEGYIEEVIMEPGQNYYGEGV